MQKFKEFFDISLITEKVSKKEINAALSNKDILIGAEFEFILDNFEIWGMDDYREAIKEYDIFEREIYKAIEQYSDINNEMYDEEKEIDKLRTKLDDAEEKQEQGAQSNLNKNTIKFLEKEIASREKKLENRQDSYLDEIDWPTIPENYEQYMENNGTSVSDYDDVFTIVAEDGDMPPGPDEPLGKDSPEEMENFMEGGMMNDAPFKIYKFGGLYDNLQQQPGQKWWAIKPDESLSEGGVEVVSPPMPLPEFMKLLPKMLKWIKEYGHTDRTCGFHVHLGLKGKSSLEDDIDDLKMIMFMDEGWVWNAFNERLDISHVQSAQKRLAKDATLSNRDVKDIFNKKKFAMRLASIHQDAINFENADGGHIEYRYMGGTDYEKKSNQLVAGIGRFAYNFSLGFDKNFKRKEYAHKVARLFNKIELFEYQKLAQLAVNKRGFFLRRAVPGGEKMPLSSKDQAKLDLLIKKWSKQRDIRIKQSKLDGKTERNLLNNVSLVKSIMAEYEKEIKKTLSKVGSDIFLLDVSHFPS